MELIELCRLFAALEKKEYRKCNCWEKEKLCTYPMDPNKVLTLSR